MTLAGLSDAIARIVFGIVEFTDGTKWRGRPDYAESITDAWRVVEAMQSKGYLCDIGSKAGGWSAFFWMPMGDIRHLIGHGETAPEAICRAALALFDEASP